MEWLIFYNNSIRIVFYMESMTRLQVFHCRLKNYFYLLYKVQCFIKISALIKLIISHVRLFMVISHLKIIAFQTITNHSFWTFYIGGKPIIYISRKIHRCLEIPDLFLVLNMIFLTCSRRSLVRYHVQHLK